MSKINELTQRQWYWLGHIEACEKSGLSIRAYADENGLKVGSLYGARHLLKEKGAWCSSEASEAGSTDPQTPADRPAKFQRVVVRPETQTAPQRFPAHAPGQDIAPCRIHLPNGVMLEVMTTTDTAALVAVVTAARAWP